jgi:hypothetical protein
MFVLRSKALIFEIWAVITNGNEAVSWGIVGALFIDLSNRNQGMEMVMDTAITGIRSFKFIFEVYNNLIDIFVVAFAENI